MKAAFLFFLLHVSVALGADSPYSEEDWLREGVAAQITKFKRTTFTPHPEQKSVVAVNCETEPSWWGQFRVFHHTGDKIDWIASIPAAYQENAGHYVLSCAWRYLEKLKMWVLEVFDSTHMGNGSLWLFTLENRDLRPVLHTTARGRFLKPPPDLVIPPFGETRLVEEHLKVDYRVPDGAAVEGIFLSGTIAALDQEGSEQSRIPYTETWSWDADKRIFIRTQP